MSSKIKMSNINGKTLEILNSDLSDKSKTVVYLDTVAQATNYVGTDGDVIHISDKDRGGIFVYDSTATDNGGTVFGKCVRQYEGAVNVKWFINNTDISDDIGINKTFSYFSECFIPEGVYNILNDIDLTGRTVSGSKTRGGTKLIIDTENGVEIKFGGLYRISNLEINGNSYNGNLLNQTSNTERTSYIKNCFIHKANRCINIDGYYSYSTIFENIEFGEFTDVGFYFNTLGSTGNVYTNLYFTNWSSYPDTKNTCTAYMWFNGSIGESSFRQINFEWGKVSNACILLNGIEKGLLESIHIEGVDLQDQATIFKVLDAGYGAIIKLNDVSLITTKLVGNNTSILNIQNSYNKNLSVKIDRFTARNSDIGTTTGHHLAIREGTIGSNSPILVIDNLETDITYNNYLPIEQSTYKPVLRKINGEYLYNEDNERIFMGKSPNIPSTGIYPKNAVVYNSNLDNANDLGWISYEKGDFSNSSHGSISITQYSSSTTANSTAYDFYNVGDRITLGNGDGTVYKITSKYNGDTFVIDPTTSEPTGTYDCNIASPLFRAF